MGRGRGGGEFPGVLEEVLEHDAQQAGIGHQLHPGLDGELEAAAGMALDQGGGDLAGNRAEIEGGGLHAGRG